MCVSLTWVPFETGDGEDGSVCVEVCVSVCLEPGGARVELRAEAARPEERRHHAGGALPHPPRRRVT